MIAKTNAKRAASAFGACCMLFALSAFSAAGSVCQGGYVHEAQGMVSMQRAGAKTTAARVGDQFETDTTFRTGPGEEAILKFADGQILALGADSAAHVGRYCYLAENLEQSGVSMELIKGQMRVIAGLIGMSRPEKLRIAAGDSTVEIQKAGGADFTVVVQPAPQEAGYALVQAGEISVRTPYGRIGSVAPGQYAPWQPGRSPAPPIPFAAAPAVIQANVAALLACVLPSNTPVTVAAAAESAGALAAAARTDAGAALDPRLAGYVQAVSRTVSIKTAGGRTVAATVGSTFEAGSTFDTGDDGRVVLKFADGQLAVLGRDSALSVGRYQFDPGDVKASESALELARGAMRIVTGSIQEENRDGLSISAGASIVDILNSGPADFTVAVDTQDRDIGIARASLGEIAVHTPYGPIGKIQPGQSRLWQPGQTAQARVAGADALALAKAAEVLQLAELPDNAPVAVTAAARAALALAAAQEAQAAASADAQDARLQAEAKAAMELAGLAQDAAASASEALAAKIFAAKLETLPPPAAGQALALAPRAPAAPIIVPIIPAVTPGAAGGCLGSKC
jgi:hypothetical protein